MPNRKSELPERFQRAYVYCHLVFCDLGKQILQSDTRFARFCQFAHAVKLFRR